MLLLFFLSLKQADVNQLHYETETFKHRNSLAWKDIEIIK